MSPTRPCGDFDTRALLGQLGSVLQRVAAIGRQEDQFSVPDITIGVADDDWHAAWSDAAHAVQAAWTDAAITGRRSTPGERGTDCSDSQHAM